MENLTILFAVLAAGFATLFVITLVYARESDDMYYDLMDKKKETVFENIDLRTENLILSLRCRTYLNLYYDKCKQMDKCRQELDLVIDEMEQLLEKKHENE